MSDRRIIAGFLAFGLGLAGYAIFSQGDNSYKTDSEVVDQSFSVDIQSGGSGTTLRTDSITNFNY